MPTRQRSNSNGNQPGVMAEPSRQELNTEMGVLLRGMPFGEEFVGPDNILVRSREPTVRQLVEMRRNDGQARALYRLLTMPVRAAASRATWIPAEGGEKEAEFAEQLLTTPAVSGGMRTPLSRVVGQMLLAVTDGFAPFELVYTVPKAGPLQGKYTLDKIAYRPSDTVYFKVDEHGDYDGFQQRTYGPNGRTIDEHIPADRSVYVACSEEEAPYYGVSYFNAAFYHYDKKVRLYYLAHLAAQHRAVGSRLGRYPESASLRERQQFRSALADFGLGQAITVPSGDKWNVEDLGKSPGDFPFMDFVNHHNSQMSKSVLAPFIDDAQGGAKSLVDFGGQSDSLYMMLIRVLVSELESVFNNWLIPRFIEWNFSSDKYPEMKFGAFSDEQVQAIRETFDKLATAGQSANVTRPFLLELEKSMANEMGIEVDYEQFDKALEKQTELTLQHFEDELATPKEPPFQAIGAVPPDRQQGVPPKQQWVPYQDQGMQPGPDDAPVAADAAGQEPGQQPSRPRRRRQRRRFPALPSQLQASVPGTPAVATWVSAEESTPLSPEDRELVELVLSGARGED